MKTKERQVELAEKLAARAIEKAFAAAEEVVAAKRAWERAERAAKRQTQKTAKGKHTTPTDRPG